MRTKLHEEGKEKLAPLYHFQNGNSRIYREVRFDLSISVVGRPSYANVFTIDYALQEHSAICKRKLFK